MEKFIVNGGKRLSGEVSVSGAKNVALKALVAACLTDEEVVIENIPHISDFFTMVDIIKHLGGSVGIEDHTAIVRIPTIINHKVSLEKAAEIRTSALFVAPLLAREKTAIIPNPGGCRIGARPIDRVIDALLAMRADIMYDHSDGYFHAETEGLQGATIAFEKNTHTGTETILMAASLAAGKTIIENAAQEPEVDDLITLLTSMGAKIKRLRPRTIEINGVEKLHGTRFTIPPDRNEIVTFAIATAVTKGEIVVKEAKKEALVDFLVAFEKAGCSFREEEKGIRFFAKEAIRPVHVTTKPSPGFMTDWQGPWTVLMTQAEGDSNIHEAVYENRFGYIPELKKMGAAITFFNPEVSNPSSFYNFNSKDDKDEYFHAIKVHGPVTLHNAVVNISDLRAGATLVLASLVAMGESVIFGVEHLDRGYEAFEKRLKGLGADIRRVSE